MVEVPAMTTQYKYDNYSVDDDEGIEDQIWKAAAEMECYHVKGFLTNRKRKILIPIEEDWKCILDRVALLGQPALQQLKHTLESKLKEYIAHSIL